MFARRYLLPVVAALYFGGLIALTFVPGSATVRNFWLWPFVAFVPVGIILCAIMGHRRWWVAVGFGVLGAAWIEAAQSIWMPEGYADLGDMFWGSLGVIVGVALVAVLTIPRARSMRSHESHRIVAQAGSREIPQD